MAEDGPDLYMYKEICTRDTCRGEIATLAEQLAERAKRNVEEFPWSSPRSVSRRIGWTDGRMDAHTSKIDKQGRGRKTDRQMKGPRTYDDGSTCPIQDVVPLVLLRGPSTPS